MSSELLPRFCGKELIAYRIRSKQSNSWDSGMEEGLTPDEREALLLEHRTWQLLRAVFE